MRRLLQMLNKLKYIVFSTFISLFLINCGGESPFGGRNEGGDNVSYAFDDNQC